MHVYSPFWLGYAAGLLRLSAAWRERPEPAEPDPVDVLDDLDMHAWLRLSDAEHQAIVERYAPSRPRRAA